MIRKRIKGTSVNIPITDDERKECDRIIGIQMYKCFGRTTFKLSERDLELARKLREQYVERFGIKK